MLAVVRPVEESDLDQVYQLALGAGFGITTLPKNKDEIARRIAHSVASFNKQIETPLDENYFFVLEDLESKKIVGTSAIEAAVGYNLPFYGYRVSKIFNICHSLNIKSEHEVLHLNNDFQGMTEIGTLYLDSQFRRNRNGLLLSRARFLFMAVAPERFGKKVIAEMRGVSDEEGISPFWESFGKHFFNMSFVKADELSVLTDKQFISDLLPHHPVHVSLLSPEAQAAIGKPHASTIPAMKILEREGFRYNSYVDIFDAGPALEVKTKELRTLRDKQALTITDLSDEVEAPAYFISNAKMNFKAVKGPVLVNEAGAILSKKTAEVLALDVGQTIHIIDV